MDTLRQFVGYESEPFPETMGALFFWFENIQALNVKKLFVQSVLGILSFSDASDLACGAILSLDNQFCHKSWSEDEKFESSTWRELKAIHFGLLSFSPFVKNKLIHWFTDNQAAAFMTHNGSRKVNLHSIAIFLGCAWLMALHLIHVGSHVVQIIFQIS